MDIIAEILETDRLAEEKLSEAREQAARLIEVAKVEQERLARQSDEDCSGYKDAIEAENDRKLSEELEGINAVRDEQIAALEKAFADNGSRWADEIFARVTALPEN